MESLGQKFVTKINTFIGQEVGTRSFPDFPKPSSASYLSSLVINGFLERVSWGKYKVLKEVFNTLDLRLINKDDLAQDILTQFSRPNPNKEVVERICLSNASQYIRDRKCLILSGPEYGRHCEELFGSGMASYLYVIERLKGVYDHIMSQANDCSYFKDGVVKIENIELESNVATDCHYLHTDIFGAYSYVMPIVQAFINEQKKLDGFKCIYFALSKRFSGTNDVLFHNIQEFLSQYFGSSMIGVNGLIDGIGKGIDMAAEKGIGKYCRQYIPLFENYGNIIDMKWFSYSDTSAMTAIQIIYQ